MLKIRSGSNFLVFIVFMSVGLAASAQTQTSLKDAYQGCFLVGAALNPSQFAGDKDAALIKEQFNSISPENVLKWEIVHPQPDTYNFNLADKYVDFGLKNDMFVIGHNLVWHSQVPKWVFQDDKGNPLTRDALLQRMHDHIAKVVGRYKGKIKGWDVVNEALNENGTLRQSQWMKIIGPDYLQKAFEFAHEADPDAELYYNDYSLENPAKRDGAVKLVQDLKAKGVHITGVGMQEHNSMDWPTVQQINDTIDAFAKLGVKVMMTELDVDVLPQASGNHTADVAMHEAADPKLNPYTKGLPDDVQQALTKRWVDLFSAYAAHCGTVERVTLWGVTDADSWKNGWPIRGRTNYPLLFDRDGKPKPAVKAVIDEAPKKK